MITINDDIDDIFTVLRPEGEVLRLAGRIQQTVNEFYQIYHQQLPLIHVTLAQFQGKTDDNALSLLKEVVRKIAAKNGAVKLVLEGFQCFSFNSHALTLKLTEVKQLRELSQEIYQGVKNAGLELEMKIKPEQLEYHITIASDMFAGRPLSNSNFQKLCTVLEGQELRAEGKSRILELWHPYLEPEKAVIERFLLQK